MSQIVKVKIDGGWHVVEVGDLSERPVRAVVDGFPVDVEIGDASEGAPAETARRPAPSRTARPPSAAPAVRTSPAAPPPSPSAAVSASASANPNKLFTAPMPGIILEISVKPGDRVVTGDTICVLEAMKMQQRLRADWSGVVKSVLVTVGQQVMDGSPIAELE